MNSIETAALGRPFQLGMLYDCRRDALVPGTVIIGFIYINRCNKNENENGQWLKKKREKLFNKKNN